MLQDSIDDSRETAGQESSSSSEAAAVASRTILELVVKMGQPGRTPQQRKLSQTLMPDIMDILCNSSAEGLEGLRDWLQAELEQEDTGTETAWEWPSNFDQNGVAPNDSKQATILIVDDELETVKLLQAMLRNEGYQQLPGTTDPYQVESLYREFQPDLVLLDLMMPGIDGFAMLETLRRLDARLPVMVLTADTSLESKRRALAAGANDFLTKPFDRTESLLRIHNLLEVHYYQLHLQRHNESLQLQVHAATAAA